MNRFYAIFLLVLLFNQYCYSFTLPYIDQNGKETLPLSDSNSQDVIKSLVNNKNDQDSYVNILCTLYGVCSDKDQQYNFNGRPKTKRLMLNVLHGFSKFGKREFRSAFAGFSKFG
ncbi:unnamed protein product [Rotaria magnacalcarata]|uniref:Uncharacterized protein n=1 Tax=Rotaria magnacalcarata TaxID=392030 RepID=A0A815X6I2_9BILA|nr:unnamed protein product [Rotaria magnacalcarata]CAF1600208.1 unnamed protein product [Rotaria magnacalcarata]CAF2091639.1 unnamed protein product [Rotaria magnacalcarata]CAF3817883.1 unnamed protein product [Rotaria magnacalcarata]CAF4996935.1 unnamed protein product [Rotaria magnacalcarata]